MFWVFWRRRWGLRPIWIGFTAIIYTLLPRLIAGDGAAVIADAEADLRTALDTATKAEQVMRAIRQFRQALNMAVTSADLLNLAPIEMQLHWLSHGADTACAVLADWLERQARQRGRLRDNARWFILAMGKLGRVSSIFHRILI